MGGYMLARGRKLTAPLAMMVAFVAALNGWIICWGATDWFGALGAFVWLPWAWCILGALGTLIQMRWTGGDRGRVGKKAAAKKKPAKDE